ncbi:MAG: hypothetical protein HY289_00550 [Planctomycetes bacterium]|nr:hypothetical protein [Planctomycetota bacterium]
MPRAHWPLQNDLPVIDIVLVLPNGLKMARTLLADTGAGPSNAPFDFVLDESDCLPFGAVPTSSVSLGGAYAGSYPIYPIRIEIPALGFVGDVNAVGVPTTPPGLDGIAAFRFLNRFTYGNFGNHAEFALEP